MTFPKYNKSYKCVQTFANYNKNYKYVLNFLIVNLLATREPPVSIDGMEDEAVVSILQDDGMLRKEEGDARTGYQHANFFKLK